MEALALLLIITALAVIGGAIAGWVAVFRSAKLERELRALQTDLAAATAGTSRLGEPSSAPDPALPAQTAPNERATPEAPEASQGDPVAEPEDADPPKPPSTPQAWPPKRRPADGPNLFAQLEQSLAGNWLVWLAGAVLALGGVFLVGVAIDNGLVSPPVQIAIAILAGAGMITGGEWLRRNPARYQGPGKDISSAIAAGAGVVTIYGAVYAAFGLYALIPGPIAFGALAFVAVLAAGLALLHGPTLVALGLVGAFVAPMLIGSDNPNAAALFAYVFAVAGAGLAVTHFVGRAWPGFLAIAGGAIWPLLWLLGGYRDDQAFALTLYLPAFLTMAAAFAWRDAGEPLSFASIDPRALSPTVAAASLAALAAAALFILLAEQSDHAPEVVFSLGAAGAIALAAAWRRESLSLMPIAMLAGTVLALYIWPEAKTTVIDATERTARALRSSTSPETPPFLTACMAFAGLYGIAGAMLAGRVRVGGPFAAIAAAAPPLCLAIAFWRVTGVAQSTAWAIPALVLAGVYLGLLEWLRRGEGGLDARPGVASAYAAGLSTAAALAVGMSMNQLWMSLGFALQAPVLALLNRRFPAPILPWLAAGFAVLATARLTIFGEAFDYDVGPWPIFNALLLGYGGAALCAWAAARDLVEQGFKRLSVFVQSLEASAMILGVSLISLQLRHALNGGDLSAPYSDSLTEVALQAAAWLGIALALRWRFGNDMAPVPRWTERVLAILAIAHIAFGPLTFANPWWGLGPEVSGPAVFNSLFLAYALPGVIAVFYAARARADGLMRIGATASVAAAGLMFVWATLEVRRAFHAPELSSGAVSEAESYAYSAVWVVVAALTLLAGVIRKRPALRYAALGLLVITSVKVCLLDMYSLGGLWRGLSFIGLGGALLGIGVLYQRVILPAGRAETQDDPEGDTPKGAANSSDETP